MDVRRKKRILENDIKLPEWMTQCYKKIKYLDSAFKEIDSNRIVHQETVSEKCEEQETEIKCVPSVSNWNSFLKETENKVLKFPGKVKYCSTLFDCGLACENLLVLANKSKLILGFDMEWPYSGKTALIQICPNESICFLLHVSRMFKIPLVLIDLLKHNNVKLTGVNVVGDLRKFGKDLKVDTESIIKNNLIELQILAKEKLNSTERWSLSGLVFNCLNKILEKPRHIRCSNWALENLNAEQIIYAATDAYASLLCCNSLLQIK